MLISPKKPAPKFLCDMLYSFQSGDKRGSLMFCISAFLMATLLLFSTMPVSLAEQQVAVQAQAEADASADMSKDKWFALDAAGSTVGCLLGCIGGSLLGGPCYGSSNSQGNLMLAGSVLCGVCAVPIAVFRYPHNVTPLVFLCYTIRTSLVENFTLLVWKGLYHCRVKSESMLGE